MRFASDHPGSMLCRFETLLPFLTAIVLVFEFWAASRPWAGAGCGRHSIRVGILGVFFAGHGLVRAVGCGRHSLHVRILASIILNLTDIGNSRKQLTIAFAGEVDYSLMRLCRLQYKLHIAHCCLE